MDQYLFKIILTAALLTAIVTDVRALRIPNWLTLGTTAMGMLVNILSDGYKGFLLSLEGLVIGLLIVLVFYLLGGMGAGDVKLMAAVGSFLGPYDVLSVSVIIALLGSVYGFAVMVLHSGFRGAVQRFGTILKTFAVTKSMAASVEPRGYQPQLRYAVVIGLGTLVFQWGADILRAVK